MPVILDGEVLLLEPPFRYRTRPRELRVLVPKPP
jgi:diacylglycerol kinase family enzyme